jgi:murein DD-endopeptidase MepM/ murein hydrolase activator NlpD
MRRDDSLARLRAIDPEEWGPGYRIWMGLLAILTQRGPDGTTSLVRLASHMVIILVAVAVIAISRMTLPQWEIAEVPGTSSLPLDSAAAAAAREARPESAASLEALVRAAVPVTSVQDRSAEAAAAAAAELAAPRTDLVQYTVKSGDSLYGIADRYHVSAETLMWANGMENNPDLLRLGQDLTVLPVSGVLHTVVKGDTVESIAKKYNAKGADILSFPYNHLDPNNPALDVGKKVIVPAGEKPLPLVQALPQAAVSANAPGNAQIGKGKFVWPTSGYVSQGYRALHRALDIAGSYNQPVKAADGGFVAIAGWSNVGYGNYIVIDHGNGFRTLYGHLNKINVKPGQSVDQGTLIGLEGSTGNSTGPHLHFEIILNGVQQNPYNILP